MVALYVICLNIINVFLVAVVYKSTLIKKINNETNYYFKIYILLNTNVEPETKCLPSFTAVSFHKRDALRFIGVSSSVCVNNIVERAVKTTLYTEFIFQQAVACICTTLLE